MNALTEDEARTKWCPFARCVGHVGPTANRGAGGSAMSDSHCIASDCMAWRWAKHPKTRKAVYAEAEHIDGARLGYCGLAGR